MRADKPGRRFAHGVFVKGEGIVEDVTPDHWRHHFPAIQPITVSLAPRRPARIEIRADLLGAGDSNRRGKQRVQSALKFLRRQWRLRSKAPDLAKRVNAGVGAPGSMQNDVLLGQAPEHSNDFPLNGGLIGLNLPTVKIGAVVGDGELEIAHGKQVISFSDQSSEEGADLASS